MIGNFIATYKRLLQATEYKHHRYVYDNFNLNNRLTGIIGPRGTGKTTLILQYIQENIQDKDECIYVSVDHIYFSQHHLLNFIHELYEDYGVRYYFFDEIHKYRNWNQELKNAYDSYPDIKIVFSGSSSIDLIGGTYDLSRRGVIFKMKGMSFREYLKFNDIANVNAVTLDQIINNRSEIESSLAKIKKIKGHFKEYMGCGYYPFYLEDIDTYKQKILRVIDKTIFEDIANFYNLKTANLTHFKRILSYLATIPPGELSINSIAGHIGLDNKTIQNYLHILYETGLIELLAVNKAGSSLLKKTEKIYLDNPDLYAAIIEEIGYEAKLGTIRESFFVRMLKNAGYNIYYSQVGDFEACGNFFEIGGKRKTKKQIRKNLDHSYLVKDDILYGNKYEIPLYLFGFLY